MKLWLDDIRHPPDNTWVICRYPEDAIRLLQTGRFYETSLDHDLQSSLTGYDVALAIESAAANDDPWVRTLTVHVHSANPVGAANMIRALASAQRWAPSLTIGSTEPAP